MNITPEQVEKMLRSNPDLSLSQAMEELTEKTQAEKVYDEAKKENLELTFETYYHQLEISQMRRTKQLNLIKWTRNYRFDPEGRMEIDFSVPELKVGIEINGGQGAEKSGHSNWNGLERDAVKQNRVTLLGWKLFWLTTSMLRKSVSLAHIQPIFEYLHPRLVFVPDWKSLPERARYAAVDPDGEWWWFERRPYLEVYKGGIVWSVRDTGSNGNIGKTKLFVESMWKESLVEKPGWVGKEDPIPF